MKNHPFWQLLTPPPSTCGIRAIPVPKISPSVPWDRFTYSSPSHQVEQAILRLKQQQVHDPHLAARELVRRVESMLRERWFAPESEVE